MQTYQMYIDDSRHTAPTLKLVTVADAERARVLAERMLAEDPNHRGVEAYLNALWVFGLGSLAGSRTEERAAG